MVGSLRRRENKTLTTLTSPIGPPEATGDTGASRTELARSGPPSNWLAAPVLFRLRWQGVAS